MSYAHPNGAGDFHCTPLSAQALIDVLPRGDLEKQSIEGFEVADKVLREKRKGYGWR